MLGPTSSRASPLPQGAVSTGDFAVAPDPVGAGLARDEAGTAATHLPANTKSERLKAAIF
ncbi:hypothetical protein D3C87_1846420 [compost metagenome]